ncbi:secondary thiamine-phosphate synthase enzyme YjbQ [Desulfovibrio sp. OttesenSCG-928-G11]|nr:secondary thiamine-phosphate synthase enzyme YjbQ [Desulfovibrio sp. OttesenSCG-928-G11]
MKSLSIQTDKREELKAISSLLTALVREQGWKNGALLIFCPHSTAALTVNEQADPDVAFDIRAFMGKLVPRSQEFRHAEGNSDAHLKSSLFGPSLMLIVDNGELKLGAWQGVYFCEWDGPRKRCLWVQFLPAH